MPLVTPWPAITVFGSHHYLVSALSSGLAANPQPRGQSRKSHAPGPLDLQQSGGPRGGPGQRPVSHRSPAEWVTAFASASAPPPPSPCGGLLGGRCGGKDITEPFSQPCLGGGTEAVKACAAVGLACGSLLGFKGGMCPSWSLEQIPHYGPICLGSCREAPARRQPCWAPRCSGPPPSPACVGKKQWVGWKEPWAGTQI